MKQTIDKYLETKHLFDNTVYDFLSSDDKTTIEDFIASNFAGLYIFGRYTETTIETYVQKNVRTLMKIKSFEYNRMLAALSKNYDILKEISLTRTNTGTQTNDHHTGTEGEVKQTLKVLPYDTGTTMVDASETSTSYDDYDVGGLDTRTDNLTETTTGNQGDIADKVLKEIEVAKVNLLEKVAYDIVDNLLVGVWGLCYEEDSDF